MASAQTSFNLPIAPGGRPPVPGIGSFQQPSGVTIGPPQGGFGNVTGSLPINGDQSTVNTRGQVRFQVQPQCTIACNPRYPLSEDIRRKDFLMSLNEGPADSSTLKYANRITSRATPVIGLKQVNDALFNLSMNEKSEDVVEKSILRAVSRIKTFGTDIDKIRDPSAVIQILQPFGVYNNRGTHDSLTQFEYTRATTREIIGVNISNYCFMRDIFGVDLRAGDTMHLYCMVFEGALPDGTKKKYCEFVPIIAEHDYNKNKEIKQQIENNAYHFCLGKIWTTPVYGPFNNREKNIVGPGGEEEDRFNFNTGNPLNPQLIYRNIEVELAPSFLCM